MMPLLRLSILLLCWLCMPAHADTAARTARCQAIALPVDGVSTYTIATQEFQLPTLQHRDIPLRATDIAYPHRATTCFKVRNTSGIAQTLALRFGNARLEHAEFLDTTNDSAPALLGVAGIDYPLLHWSSHGGEVVFEYTLAANDTRTVQLNIAAMYPYSSQIDAGDRDTVDALLYRQQVLTGTLAGVIFSLIIYALFLAIANRDITYFYLSVSTVTVALLQLSDLGSLYGLWPDSPWWNKQCSVSFAVTSTIAGVLLAQNYLLTRQFLPRAHRLLTIYSAYLLLVCLPLSLSSNRMLHNIFFVFPALLFMISLITMSILRIRQGYAPARLYLVAIMLPVIAGFAIAMTYTGYVEPTPLSRLLPLAASAIQLILFALALGERINWLNEQQEISKQQALVAETETAAKKNFLAHISHELRTPLAGIIGLAEMTHTNPLYESNKPLIQGLESSARHLLETTNLLLDHARLDAGKWSTKSSTFAIQGLLDATVSQFQRAAARKQLSITTRAENIAATHLEADEDIIRRILEQLVDNAIKFTEDGGILITAETQLLKNRLMLRLDVVDTGKGIQSEYRPRIFELFELADSSTTRSSQGLGLGLSLCKKFCDLLGGDIGCESNAQQGTAFWFRVPCAAAAPPAAPPPTKPEPAPTKPAPATRARTGKKWLVAEDDETLQMIVASQLEKLAVQHTVYPNGKPLVADYEANPDDVGLVLLDWNMPICNASQAIEAIRQFEQSRGLSPVRIVVLSAYDRHSARDMITAPADITLLQKPVTEADLVRLLS